MLNTIWKRVKPWCIPVALTLLIYLFLQFIALIGYVPSSSMEPTLPKGSFIFGWRIFSELEVGDIIVFQKDGQLMVKRIAAGPGDIVDRRELTYSSSGPIPAWEDTILIIPEGCYFVLGDNAEDSFDSRYWENPFVSRKAIVAKLNHLFSDFDTTFDEVRFRDGEASP